MSIEAILEKLFNGGPPSKEAVLSALCTVHCEENMRCLGIARGIYVVDPSESALENVKQVQAIICEKINPRLSKDHPRFEKVEASKKHDRRVRHPDQSS